MRGLLLLAVVGLVSAACPQGIKKAVYVPHESNASRYYLCNGEWQELLACSKGLVFDAKTQKCTSGKAALRRNSNEDSRENSKENDDNSRENSRENGNSRPNSREDNNSRNDNSREN